MDAIDEEAIAIEHNVLCSGSRNSKKSVIFHDFVIVVFMEKHYWSK